MIFQTNFSPIKFSIIQYYFFFNDCIHKGEFH